MPSKKPSRQRERERRERERNAQRPLRFIEREAAAFKRLLARLKREDASPLDRSIAMLDFAASRAGVDPGMPPEYRRQQIAQFASQLGKLADPKKQLDELVKIREAVSKAKPEGGVILRGREH